MKINKHLLGEITIYEVVEIEDASDLIQMAILGLDDCRIEVPDGLSPHFEHRKNIKAQVAFYIIDDGNYLSMIDAGIGNDKRFSILKDFSGLSNDLRGCLYEVGVNISDITRVVYTHLHCDHIGWGSEVPNARHIFEEKELRYWLSNPKEQIEDDREAFRESFGFRIDKLEYETFNSGDKVTDFIKSIPTPGHTPNHVSFEISSRGHRALILGDVFLHPVQMLYDFSSDSDADRVLANETRQEILRYAKEHKVQLFGTHFVEKVVLGV